ncbi:MAG TPA: MoaD/ThiS family protein [Hyalangium sp.]|jgi:molybdopterin converting factor small subunit|nr:MoaD/ThiS family protein [Hyalangium sp.]
MAKVRIPTPLLGFTRNQREVSVPGATVGEVLFNLGQSYPGIGPRLLDSNGAVLRYVTVFYKDEDVRFLQQLNTPVTEEDSLTILAAMAGG